MLRWGNWRLREALGRIIADRIGSGTECIDSDWMSVWWISFVQRKSNKHAPNNMGGEGRGRHPPQHFRLWVSLKCHRYSHPLNARKWNGIHIKLISVSVFRSGVAFFRMLLCKSAYGEGKKHPAVCVRTLPLGTIWITNHRIVAKRLPGFACTRLDFHSRHDDCNRITWGSCILVHHDPHSS